MLIQTRVSSADGRHLRKVARWVSGYWHKPEESKRSLAPGLISSAGTPEAPWLVNWGFVSAPGGELPSFGRIKDP